MEYSHRIGGLTTLQLVVTFVGVLQPALSSTADEYVESACPITTAYESGIKGPIPDNTRFGWYGSDSLAVLIPRDGIWTGSGPENVWGDKSWWWSQSYDHRQEPVPELEVSARQLDDELSLVIHAQPTNAILSERSAMLVGLRFPSTGCWEIRGEYQGQTLKYVVLVKDDPDIRKMGSQNPSISPKYMWVGCDGLVHRGDTVPAVHSGPCDKPDR